jgi:hypothetical protein
MRIDIVDRYLDHSFFHRYLYGTVVSPKVTLLTVPQPAPGGRDAGRYREFLDVSRLYAQERGPDKYTLLTLPPSDFHDRWLRRDDELFLLGGSPKDLEKLFTIGKLERLNCSVPVTQAIHDRRHHVWLWQLPRGSILMNTFCSTRPDLPAHGSAVSRCGQFFGSPRRKPLSHFVAVREGVNLSLGNSCL